MFDPDGSMWCPLCAPSTPSKATEAGDPETWVPSGVGAVAPFKVAFRRPDTMPEPVARLADLAGQLAAGDDGVAAQAQVWLDEELPKILSKAPRGPGMPATSDDTVAGLDGQQSMADAVNNPSHYTSSPAKCSQCGHPIECIDITQHMGYCLGNATKYVWRCDLKNDAIEDLRKAIQCIEFEIAKRERQLAADNNKG